MFQKITKGKEKAQKGLSNQRNPFKKKKIRENAIHASTQKIKKTRKNKKTKNQTQKQRIFRRIKQINQTDKTVLILGKVDVK